MKKLVVLLLVVACRDAKHVAHDAGAAPCARVGQSCEVAPGKLGTCVESDTCAAPPCFVCQSQH